MVHILYVVVSFGIVVANATAFQHCIDPISVDIIKTWNMEPYSIINLRLE